MGDQACVFFRTVPEMFVAVEKFWIAGKYWSYYNDNIKYVNWMKNCISRQENPPLPEQRIKLDFLSGFF